MDPVQSTLPQQPEQQVPVQPEGKKFNIWLLVVIVFGILLLGLGGYFIMNQSKLQKPVVQITSTPKPVSPTQAPDPTANWKTYTSIYGYEIQYPLGWKVNTTRWVEKGQLEDIQLSLGENEEARIVFRDYSKPAQEGGPPIYTHELILNKPKENTSAVSIDEWIKKELGNEFDLSDLTETKVAGIRSVKRNWSNVETVYIPYKNRIYSLSYTGGNNVSLPFDQILSTFKFTDQTQDLDTSTWKTYTHPQIGFSFNYPNNWDTSLIDNIPGGTSPDQLLIGLPPFPVTKEAPVKLFIHSNPENLSIEDLKKRLTGNSGIGPGLDSSGEKVNMTGESAYYKKEDYCVSVCQSYTWAHNKFVYKLINYPNDVLNQSEIFNKIFSTFKFTE